MDEAAPSSDDRVGVSNCNVVTSAYNRGQKLCNFKTNIAMHFTVLHAKIHFTSTHALYALTPQIGCYHGNQVTHFSILKSIIPKT